MISLALSSIPGGQGHVGHDLEAALHARPGGDGFEPAFDVWLILQAQHRVTASFRRKDGRTLHVRKATRAEPHQLNIYSALGLDPAPGGIKKMTV